MSGINYIPIAGVSIGGTGDATLAAHEVLLGEGISPVATVSGSSTGQILTWVSSLADPTFQTPSVTKWSLVNSWTYSSDINSVSFTGLSGYSAIYIVLRNVTSSAASIRRLRVSTDNGVTYLSAAGDYLNITAGGGTTNKTSIELNGAFAGAISPIASIFGFNVSGSPKPTKLIGTPDYIVPTTTALNAIELSPDIGNFTGGSIYVLGM